MDDVLKPIIAPAAGSFVILLVFLTIILPMNIDNKDEIHVNNIEIVRITATLANLDNSMDSLKNSMTNLENSVASSNSKIDDKLDKLYLAICYLSDGTHC